MERFFSDELAAFLESGLSIVVGVRDLSLRPDGAAALAARVHDDRAHLTLFLYEENAERIRSILDECPQIAVTLDLPTTHRACQVKGVVVEMRAATESDRPEVLRQLDCFNRDLEELGYPRAMFAQWKVWPCTAIVVRAHELFEQTPGPGTGERLRCAAL